MKTPPYSALGGTIGCVPLLLSLSLDYGHTLTDPLLCLSQNRTLRRKWFCSRHRWTCWMPPCLHHHGALLLSSAHRPTSELTASTYFTGHGRLPHHDRPRRDDHSLPQQRRIHRRCHSVHGPRFWIRARLGTFCLILALVLPCPD
jgi:hypothetical protein